jgi:hypothetical protein
LRTAEAHAREQRNNRGGFGNNLPANSMASRVSFQGLTTSSARRGAAEATDSDAATLLARRAGRRSGEAKVAVIARRIQKEMLRGCAGRVSAAHAREQWRLSCEQENPEACGGVNLANQSGSIVSSHDPRHPATSTLRHRRALLVANSIHRGNSLSTRSPSQPRLSQGLP